MALATRCPSCSTVFRISTAQAAAKGGMVRCGQCRNVFNSLDALVRVEDLEVIDEVVVEAPAAADVPVPAPFDETVDASTVVPADEAAAEPVVLDEAVEVPAPTPEPVEPAVIREWWLPETEPVAQSQLVESPHEPAPAPRDDAGQLLSGRRTDLQWSEADLTGTSPAFMRAMEPPPPPNRLARIALAALVLIALVGLLGQAAYLWRDELAARWSPARGWLIAACQPLRCKVDYPAHIDSITIESASIKSNGPNLNVYELTALLRNRDSIDIRYPYLELVLTDLQDRPILRRALRPEDYVPSGRDAGRSPTGFAAQSELPISVMFELSDLRFAGFRVERFYP